MPWPLPSNNFACVCNGDGVVRCPMLHNVFDFCGNSVG